MKRFSILLSILLITNMAVFSQARISFDTMSQDLGYLLWRNPATVKYVFTNTGDKPLVVSNVTVSCGCMEANWSKAPVPAGGKGYVEATFDAEAIGHFYKEVGVYCNASNLPIYLDFNGEVTADPKDFAYTHKFAYGAIRLNKEEIIFDDVNKGGVPEYEILVANTSNRSYMPVLMHLPPYLTATAEPKMLGKNENGKIIVKLDTEKLPKLGITRTSVYMSRFMGDKVSPDTEIPVSVVLLPDFTKMTDFQKQNPPVIDIKEKVIEFPGLKPKQKKSYTVVITNTGKSNLEILDLQVFSLALNVDLNKSVIRPGETAKMKVTVLAKNLHKGKGTPRVLMITNDPSKPKVSINVKASLISD